MDLWISQAASAPKLLGVRVTGKDGVNIERKGGPFSPLGVAFSDFARGAALNQANCNSPLLPKLVLINHRGLRSTFLPGALLTGV